MPKFEAIEAGVGYEELPQDALHPKIYHTSPQILGHAVLRLLRYKNKVVVRDGRIVLRLSRNGF